MFEMAGGRAARIFLEPVTVPLPRKRGPGRTFNCHEMDTHRAGAIPRQWQQKERPTLWMRGTQCNLLPP